MYLLYNGDNKLHFAEMMLTMVVMYYLYYTKWLSWILLVLAYWINNARIDISLHFDTITHYGVNQSFLLHLTAAWESEKQYILI